MKRPLPNPLFCLACMLLAVFWIGLIWTLGAVFYVLEGWANLKRAFKRHD